MFISLFQARSTTSQIRRRNLYIKFRKIRESRLLGNSFGRQAWMNCLNSGTYFAATCLLLVLVLRLHTSTRLMRYGIAAAYSKLSLELPGCGKCRAGAGLGLMTWCVWTLSMRADGPCGSISRFLLRLLRP